MKMNLISEFQTRKTALGVGIALAFALLTPILAQEAREFLYDIEYEAIGYSTNPPTDPIARLEERIERGEVELQFEAENGYLPSLLEALDVDVSSQVLVFSKTSVRVDDILPETPRAIYFGDDVYVAWVPGSDLLEIASMDPELGPLFYILSQDDNAVFFDRQMEACLRCHDSLTMSGGGVPRFILGSGWTDRFGELVSHEGWILTTDRTPLKSRWGGWYATGTHGDQEHIGNLVIQDLSDFDDLDLARTGNVTDLGTLIDTDPYLGKHSDMVALMVIEHQVHVQNLITRVNYDTRVALQSDAQARDELTRTVSDETLDAIESIAEPLVGAMLLVGEATIGDQITGTSGFATRFEDQGPRDRLGRSLRQLDLSERLFQYPCSYLIYSEAFDALPEVARTYVYHRLWEILSGRDPGEEFEYLTETDRAAILEILEDTKPDFVRLRSEWRS